MSLFSQRAWYEDFHLCFWLWSIYRKFVSFLHVILFFCFLSIYSDRRLAPFKYYFLLIGHSNFSYFCFLMNLQACSYLVPESNCDNLCEWDGSADWFTCYHAWSPEFYTQNLWSKREPTVASLWPTTSMLWYIWTCTLNFKNIIT